MSSFRQVKGSLNSYSIHALSSVVSSTSEGEIATLLPLYLIPTNSKVKFTSRTPFSPAASLLGYIKSISLTVTSKSISSRTFRSFDPLPMAILSQQIYHFLLPPPYHCYSPWSILILCCHHDRSQHDISFLVLLPAATNKFTFYIKLRATKPVWMCLELLPNFIIRKNVESHKIHLLLLKDFNRFSTETTPRFSWYSLHKQDNWAWIDQTIKPGG